MFKTAAVTCVFVKQSLQTAQFFSRHLVSFSINDNPIERVDSFSHLGHVITSNLSDKENILFRRDCFISKVNVLWLPCQHQNKVVEGIL